MAVRPGGAASTFVLMKATTRSIVATLVAWAGFVLSGAAAAAPVAAGGDDGNAAVVLRQAYELLQPARQEGLTDALDRAEEAADVDELRRLVNEHADALAKLRQAAKLERCDWGYDYTLGPALLLPELSPARTLARLALARARTSADDGKHDEAVEDLAAVFALAAHHAKEPIVICRLVAAAIRGRAADEAAALTAVLPEASRRKLAGRLAGLPEVPDFASAVQGEVLLTVDYLARLAAAPDAAAAAKPDGPVGKLVAGAVTSQERIEAFLEVWNDADERAQSLALLRSLLERAVKASDEAGPDPDRFAAAMHQIEREAVEDPIAAVLFPNLESVRRAILADQATQRMLLAGLTAIDEGPDAAARLVDPGTARPFVLDPPLDAGALRAGEAFSVVSGLIRADGTQVQLRFPRREPR